MGFTEEIVSDHVTCYRRDFELLGYPLGVRSTLIRLDRDQLLFIFAGGTLSRA